MAQLTNEDFYNKWVPLLADNVFQDIDGKRFEQLLADIRDSFASLVGAASTPVAPAVNFDPVTRQLTATHVLGTEQLEFNQNNGGFTAYAPVQVNDLGHGQGEWRFRVKAATGRNASQATDSPQIAVKGTGNAAGPGKIKAADISDSTEAGRALLTAEDVTAQRKLLDKFVILAGQYGIGQPRFEHVAGEDGLHAYLLRGLASLAVGATPSAPTAGQVDDQGDVFSFLPPTGYSFAQLKVAGLPDTTGAEWLNAANSYVQNGRIYVRVPGAVPKGGLAVCVGASGNVPDGQVLTNADPFTANNIVPTVPGALKVDFTVDNASLSPGDTLEFTAVASGGTAPYQHSVQALEQNTGTVTSLGTASTASYRGTWPKVSAGVYLVSDTVTDAAGASLVSKARRVVVAEPGGGGSGVDLLRRDNNWLGTNYYEQGVQFKSGTGIDKDGQFFFYSGSFGNKFAWRDNVQSMAQDSLIAWRDSDYTTSGTADTGLARNSPGVVEVNTGTPGMVGTLLSKDVVALAAPSNLNSITLLAQAILNTGLLPGAKVLWVCGGLSYYASQRGNPSKPFPNLPAAQDASYDGDLIVVQVGGTATDFLRRPYYREDFLLERNVRIVFQQGAIYGGIFQLSRYGDSDPGTLFKRQLIGGEFINRTLAWRHSGGDLEIEVIGAKFTGNGNFEVAGGGSARNDFLTSARLRNCLFDVNITDTTFGAIRLIGRDDMGPIGVVLENTRVISVRTPTITFVANAASFVTLQGALTELVGTAPETRPTVPSGYVIAQKDWLHDQRPTSSAYTDSQARAAQLNRVAPGGTTAVAFRAESPTDYAFYSGTFTTDVANAVVGVVVFVELGAGASQPALDAGTFELAGGAYASGKRNEYGFRVAASGKIHYVINQLP